MTLSFVILLALGAVSGGLINGLAGFGTAMFALGFWLQIMPPVQAVAIVLVMSVVSGIQGVWIVRQAVWNERTRLARFLLPGLVGIPIGINALSILDPHLLKLVIATIMLLYGGLFLFRRGLPKMDRATPVADMAVGFAGGVLGGAASLSGALPTMWCALRPWTKSETRAVLQPYNVLILGVSAGILAVKGAYDRETLTYLMVVLPVTMIAAQVGIMVFHRINDIQFRRLIIGLMFVSGLTLMARELLL